MSVAIVTGSGGLIGAEASRFLDRQGLDVVGIDNDMRAHFFGQEASTRASVQKVARELRRYTHHELDIRDAPAIERVFAERGKAISLVVHTAAQPSHDWAAQDPVTDFSVNANGTMAVLEATRKYCPDAVFIFCSTNKVYGDTPNFLPLVERETRWEVSPDHPFAEHGIDETMSIDGTLHSLFGVSKSAADLMVQEYGRYFGMKTACFRGGCLTGPAHAGAELHGFLSYLVKCAVIGRQYNVFGYKGKQVRDNIHSADLVSAFWEFFNAPRSGEVYNMGGGRFANCSMMEAFAIVEEITGRRMNWRYLDQPRRGDHIWWISDTRRFRNHYPAWVPQYDIRRTLGEICAAATRQEAVA